MEQTLLEEDMIHYIWYKRSYCLVSSRNSVIHSSIEFCPFCGKDVGSDAVDEEYADAYHEASEKDPTFPEPYEDDQLEEFRIKFLTEVELNENKS
jgi:hypothetical protein